MLFIVCSSMFFTVHCVLNSVVTTIGHMQSCSKTSLQNYADVWTVAVSLGPNIHIKGCALLYFNPPTLTR